VGFLMSTADRHQATSAAHAAQLPRLRPLDDLPPAAYGEEIRAAVDYAIDGDRTVVVVGVEQASGHPAWCEYACASCVEAPGAVVVVPDLNELRGLANGATAGGLLAGRAWTRFERGDGRSALVVKLGGGA
jgi:hypothetical protein